MVYARKGPYVNVSDPKAPPAGAKHIDAEYLNGVEDFLVAQDTANATYAKVRVDTTVGKRVFVKDAAGVEHLVSADTGWRNITSLLPAGISATGVAIRREGPLITVALYRLVSTTGGVVTILTPPAGYSPGAISGVVLRSGLVSAADGSNTRMTSPFGGDLRILSMVANMQFDGTFSYYTNDAWPTVLPGTPG